MNNKPFIILIISAVVFYAVMASSCVAGGQLEPNMPSEKEILEKFTRASSWAESVSMEININCSQKGAQEKLEHYNRYSLFRRDGKKVESINKVIIPKYQKLKKGLKDALRGSTIFLTDYISCTIITEEWIIGFDSLEGKNPKQARFYKELDDFRDAALQSPTIGGPLWNRFFGSNYKSIPELLSEAQKLVLAEKMEKVNNLDCYVLEADTKYGKVTAYIVPERGYNAARWIVKKKDNDLYDDISIQKKWRKPVNEWSVVFDCKDFEKINNRYIPAGGILVHSLISPGEEIVMSYEYKVAKIQLNPDFEQLEAFKIDLPNGTSVDVEQYPEIRCVWQNGKVVDKDGKVIMDPNVEKKKPSKSSIDKSEKK